MNKSKKIWLGVLAFLPLVSGVILVIFMLTSFLPAMMRMDHHINENEMPFTFFAEFMPLIIMGIIAGILSIALLIYFIIHVMNNVQLKSEERIIWILVFIFASSIGFPIYWCIRIWPDPKPETNFVRQ